MLIVARFPFCRQAVGSRAFFYSVVLWRLFKPQKQKRPRIGVALTNARPFELNGNENESASCTSTISLFN
jgi:hypothetical protein